MATNLTVHRNKIESRRKRDLSKTLKSQTEALVREQDIRAYAIVGISSDGSAFALWDTGAILPRWAFPSTVFEILRKDISDCTADDDWKPNLTLKGSL